MNSAYKEFKENFLKDNCKKCRLHENRTNLVFDRGNPEASLLVIGEAPGADEDKAGKCFVGRAGKMLDNILGSIGLDSNKDTLIVNVVKSRPPDNRVPLKDEVEACRPYLAKQMALVKPKAIVLLGSTAFYHVFPRYKKKKLAEVVGKMHSFKPFSEEEAKDYFGRDKEFSCMVLYHPAYLLYDPRKKAVMSEHVQILAEFLEREGIRALSQNP